MDFTFFVHAPDSFQRHPNLHVANSIIVTVSKSGKKGIRPKKFFYFGQERHFQMISLLCDQFSGAGPDTPIR
jgi:hypothetical protein